MAGITVCALHQNLSFRIRFSGEESAVAQAQSRFLVAALLGMTILLKCQTILQSPKAREQPLRLRSVEAPTESVTLSGVDGFRSRKPSRSRKAPAGRGLLRCRREFWPDSSEVMVRMPCRFVWFDQRRRGPSTSRRDSPSESRGYAQDDISWRGQLHSLWWALVHRCSGQASAAVPT